MKLVKNCVNVIVVLAAVVCGLPVYCANDPELITVDPGTGGTAPGVRIQAASGEQWNAFFYELKDGQPNLLTTATQTATTQPLLFAMPDVKADTYIEAALTTGTEPDETDFLWRTLARPDGADLMAYQGQKHMLPPADFDKYWERARKQLDVVEPNERVTREPDGDTSTGILYKVELDSVENTTVVGWFFVPRDAYLNGDPAAEVVKEYPAVIITPGYGATEPPIDRTKEGYITFSTNPRNHGPSKAYWKSPVEHLVYNIYEPENYYYKLAALDCLQAARFVFSRDEVQKDRVGAEGGSQGGYFAVATAMLEQRIRCVAANIIAFTDYPDGMELAIKGHHTTFRKLLQDQDTSVALAEKSLAYTDGVNLITRVKAPIQINMGGVDPVCNYVCGIVAFNRIPRGVEKEFNVFPNAGHQVPGEMREINQQWFERWLKTTDSEKSE